MRWMQASGVAYWKVDYGHQEKDEAWRRHLTEMGRQTAPGLTIETALIPHAITWGDTYRTYDVDALLSVPQTLGRVVSELDLKAEPPAKGLINCEDEVYLGAALGCCYGVMRHSFVGNLPSGRQDFVFPPITRDLKHCTDEVVRAVRWHRIAPAFAVGANPVATSSELLTDNWFFQKERILAYPRPVSSSRRPRRRPSRAGFLCRRSRRQSAASNRSLSPRAIPTEPWPWRRWDGRSAQAQWDPPVDYRRGGRCHAARRSKFRTNRHLRPLSFADPGFRQVRGRASSPRAGPGRQHSPRCHSPCSHFRRPPPNSRHHN